MQTASGTLAAAIIARERRPVATVVADWARDGSFTFEPGVFREVYSDTYEGVGDMGDLTGMVEDISIDRSLATDLPVGAKVDTGYGAAAGTVTLAGAFGGLPLSRVFAAYSNPLAYLTSRIGVPVRIEMGMRTSAGVETLRQFTGRIRSVDVDPGSGTVSLAVLDNRSDVRTPVSLPVKAGTDSGRDSVSFITYIVGAQTPVPTATYEASQNTLTATPVVDTSDPWDLLQQLADAEQGVILFDEGGTFRFYNRDHMGGGAAVTTITTTGASANLKSLTSNETGDSVRNYISVNAVPQVLDPPSTSIWALSEVLEVAAGGGITVGVEMPGVVYTLTALAYGANTLADGSGSAIGNLVITATRLSNTQWTIQVANPNGFSAFLVGVTGSPDLHMQGQCIRSAEGGYAAVRSDSGSASTYGSQSLDVAANVFRQSTTAAEGLADHLMDALREPHPTLSQVEIVGDPRLQLADRVRVVEADGLALDADFWLVGISTTFSASSGLAQSVTLRQV